jgi:putative spermidine/putrescine transport system permease protein
MRFAMARFNRGGGMLAGAEADGNDAPARSFRLRPYLLLAPMALAPLASAAGFLAWALHGFYYRYSAPPYEKFLAGAFAWGAHGLAAAARISLAAAVLSTVAAALALRAFMVHDFAGKRLFMAAARPPAMLASWALCVGLYALFERSGLLAGLGPAFIHMVFALPLSLSAMRHFMDGDSLLLEEHARVLGAGPFFAFTHALLPSISPGVVLSVAAAFLLSMAQRFLETANAGHALGIFPATAHHMAIGGALWVYGVAYVAPALFMLSAFQAFGLALRRFRGKR